MQMIAEDDVLRADVYIGPPNDGDGSDEDSGDENDGAFDNLTASQLQAPAEVVAVHTGGVIHMLSGLDVSDEEDNEEETSSVHAADASRMTAQPPSKRRSVLELSCNWKIEDIPTGLRTQQP